MPPDSEGTLGDVASGLNAEEVLLALDEALTEHERWMSRWHRAVVCRIPPDPEIVADDQHLATEFGRWYTGHADDPLLRQPAVRELWQTYMDVHALAKMLAERATDDRPIPEVEYDELVRRLDAFRAGVRRLRDAFRKAVSELDPLTGLSTRSVMMAELEREYERALRGGNGSAGLAVALADIDHFKQVNDTYGHAVGDEVLTAVAGRFLSRLRPTDSIYRYGGEEFLISLPNASRGTAMSVLERLRVALAERAVGLDDGRHLDVTASFGVAHVQKGVPLKEIIERADRALYEAKHGGRNKVVGWHEDLDVEGSDDGS